MNRAFACHPLIPKCVDPVWSGVLSVSNVYGRTYRHIDIVLFECTQSNTETPHVVV
jgi:hypothetical protein